MAEFTSPKQPEAKWEPGTLDNTRRNIGPINQEEAKKMMEKLGGEIFTEKSVPIDYSAFPKSKEYSKRAVGKSASSIASSAQKTLSEAGTNKYGYAVTEKSAEQRESLPEIAPHERQLMDRIMMSEDFKIKSNYGFFNFFRNFKKNGWELVKKDFIEYDVPKHIEHLQEFITTTKSIIQIAPDTYKSKILTSSEDKFKFLKTVGNWTMREIKNNMLSLQEAPEETTVAQMIPFIKSVYQTVLKIYYLGESRISNYFKEIYNDLIKYPKFDKNKILVLSKTGITEWFYVYSKVIKGFYPLLMRMCSAKFEYFQDFFLVRTSEILNFLGMTKFDLLLPNKKAERKQEEKQEKPVEEKKTENSDEQKKKTDEEQKKNDLVEAGIKLLDSLFPEAGFTRLDQLPDMYPYFQPLYQFRDGYNLLSPLNPLQITVTLLRITEDIFQGCRNIVFTEENDDDSANEKEKLSTVLSEWSVYREVLFEKYYGEQICDFVNNQYSQGDFKSSLFGKKMITTMLWQTKYNFLPHFEFEQLLLEKPKNDSQYRPLCMRTDFLQKFLSSLSKNIDEAKGKGTVLGIQNPWEKYHFDIPNVVSKRMDVLLGAKRTTNSAATNANLIKYALCVIAVLDWWVNNPSSPAYSTDAKQIYRVNPDDGGPAFSVPVRDDQNKLFANRVKQAIEKQKSEANHKNG